MNDLETILQTAIDTYNKMETLLKQEGRVAGRFPHPAVAVQAEAFKQIAKLTTILGKNKPEQKKTALEEFADDWEER